MTNRAARTPSIRHDTKIKPQQGKQGTTEGETQTLPVSWWSEVPIWPVAEFRRVPKVNSPALQLEPEFGTALRQALACCSDNPARPLLNGACLDVTDKQFHYVIGTNGRMLFSANSFGFNLPQSVIIPDSPFLEWTGFLDEQPGLLSVEPGQAAQPAHEGQPAQEARPGYVKLQAGPWSFITEEIPGKFPDWKQAVPRPNGNWTCVNLSSEAMRQLVLVTPNLPGGEPPQPDALPGDRAAVGVNSNARPLCRRSADTGRNCEGVSFSTRTATFPRRALAVGRT